MSPRTKVYGPEDELLAVLVNGVWCDAFGGVFADRVHFELDGDEPGDCTMTEFLASNSDHLDDPEVYDLLTGGTIFGGGGAAPEFKATGYYEVARDTMAMCAGCGVRGVLHLGWKNDGRAMVCPSCQEDQEETR